MQVPPAATVPPTKLTLAAPATGAKTGMPHPLVLAAGVGATTIAPGEVGKVSLNCTATSAVAGFGLVIVKVSVVGTFGLTGLGANILAIDGGCTDTVRSAVAAVALLRATPSAVLVSAAAAIELV